MKRTVLLKRGIHLSPLGLLAGKIAERLWPYDALMRCCAQLIITKCSQTDRNQAYNVERVSMEFTTPRSEGGEPHEANLLLVEVRFIKHGDRSKVEQELLTLDRHPGVSLLLGDVLVRHLVSHAQERWSFEKAQGVIGKQFPALFEKPDLSGTVTLFQHVAGGRFDIRSDDDGPRDGEREEDRFTYSGPEAYLAVQEYMSVLRAALEAEQHAVQLRRKADALRAALVTGA